MKPHYSGKKSKAFWKKIDNIKDQTDYHEAYLIGVILQDIERSMLMRLNQYLK